MDGGCRAICACMARPARRRSSGSGEARQKLSRRSPESRHSRQRVNSSGVCRAIVRVAITTTAFGFKQTQHKLARFRQTNKNQPHMHHDVLEFPDGEQVLLTCLQVNQLATVLQLPAAPKTEAEAKEQERVAFVEYAALKEQERAAQERAALFVEYAALREQERAAQESERHLSAKTQCPQDGG
jgi:hypothetical protein